jgi:hypothetical protein
MNHRRYRAARATISSDLSLLFDVSVGEQLP